MVASVFAAIVTAGIESLFLSKYPSFEMKCTFLYSVGYKLGK
jgi:hypothetical protein